MYIYAICDPNMSKKENEEVKDSIPRTKIPHYVIKVKNKTKGSEFKIKSLIFWCEDQNE